ncbi:MAG: hypothetical protein PHV32_16890 [Eubacteriales bacterium]|nr:hypothetical protein [Eubacteriales bacterium]
MFKKKEVKETVINARFDHEAKNVSKLMDLISDGFEVTFNRTIDGYEVTLNKNGISANHGSWGGFETLFGLREWDLSDILDGCFKNWQDKMNLAVEQYLTYREGK